MCALEREGQSGIHSCQWSTTERVKTALQMPNAIKRVKLVVDQ